MNSAFHLRLGGLHTTVAERILWLGAVVCLGFGATTVCRRLLVQHESVQQYPVLAAQSATAPQAMTSSQGAHIEGRLEIHALHLSAPILSECSDSALRLGSCHVEGTAVAGGLGNMGVAGHRDGTFRPLRNIRRGQVIDIFAESGHFQYMVDTTGVVAADDTSVLAIGEVPELTLITCFPFNYVGSAPKRFIVHAHLLSVSGDAA